jgi:hypothetical protein
MCPDLSYQCIWPEDFNIFRVIQLPVYLAKYTPQMLIDVFHCVFNQSLDVDCLLPAPNLVEERIQRAQARICAQHCGSW